MTGEPQPIELAEAGELSERLREALACLPAKQAEAFCLFHLDGWDYHEIARYLSSTVSNVGVLLHRARHRLRKLLATQADQPTQKATHE